MKRRGTSCVRTGHQTLHHVYLEGIKHTNSSTGKTKARSGARLSLPDVGKVDVDQARLDDDVRDTDHALCAKAAPTSEAAEAAEAAEAEGEGGVRQLTQSDEN